MEFQKKYVFKNAEAVKLFESKHPFNIDIISFIKNKGFLTVEETLSRGIYFEDSNNDLSGDNFIDIEEFEFFKELNNTPAGVKVENDPRVTIDTTVTKENYKELIAFLQETFE